MKKNIKIVKVIGKISIVILFFTLLIIFGNAHEHWSDEAQSYLLARDTNLKELFSYMKYEGTPPLWVFIIKLFIVLGGTYETFYLLPIVFSSLGVIIFEFKIKAPWYIKAILPFTYFIFYQYGIVARSYCLIFPMLMIIALVYKKRFEKPILYSIVLFIFMNISLHTLVISGSLYLLYIIDIFKNKKFKENKIRIALTLIFLELLITLILTMPSKNAIFLGGSGTNLFNAISEATVGNNSGIVFDIIITLSILTVLIIGIKDRSQLIRISIIFIPIILIYLIIISQIWHLGILFLLLVWCMIVSDKINTSKLIKVLIFFILWIQTYWMISSCNYDFSNKYSASKETAEFLIANNFENKTIYGVGYGVTGIQPYFNNTIFANWKTDKAFFNWNRYNGYMRQKELINGEADIYIIAEHSSEIKVYKSLMQKLESELYTKYKFEGHTYIKDYIFESESYFVYIKK